MKTRMLNRFLFLALIAAIIQPAWSARPELRCRPDGTFKILMFSDVQDDATIDPRTTALMENLLDTEKPDLVVVGGDCIAGYSVSTADEVKQAMAAVAYPMEKRKIPWTIVFGNHDEEHAAKSGIDKAEAIRIYASYPCNLNVRGDTKIGGVGNDDLLIKDKTGSKPIFCAWLIDSGMYPKKGYPGVYDWIHGNQVDWYSRTSKDLEITYGHKIPGIMFFHIPLQEFGKMWASGAAKGDKNEPECHSRIHSAIFSAVLQRGDVKGIFCGHDHTNNYIGDWHGVKLGYDASVGYASYYLKDDNPNQYRSRGGRVFLIKESDPWHFETWMRFINGATGP